VQEHKLGEVGNKTIGSRQYTSQIFLQKIIKIGQCFTTLRLMKYGGVFLTHGVDLAVGITVTICLFKASESQVTDKARHQYLVNMLMKSARHFQRMSSTFQSFIELITDSLQFRALWPNAVDRVQICGNELLSALAQLLSTCYVVLLHQQSQSVTKLSTHGQKCFQSQPSLLPKSRPI